MKSLFILFIIFHSSFVIAEPISEMFLSEKDDIKKNDVNALGKLQEKYIARFMHLEDKCGTDKDYFDLITIGYLIEGAHFVEFYSKVASRAIMLCPNNLLKVLKRHHGEPSSNFVNMLGVRIPPWEVGEAIYSEVIKPEHMQVYNNYFKEWIHHCVNDKGKAVEGCKN